ncbi:MAG: MFS transporter [Spirosomataceae bacterium]
MTPKPIGRYRWTICALVFFATTINYLDRAVISLLKSTLEVEFSWSETDYGNLVILFNLSYALGMLGAGRLVDKLGTKWGYGIATTLWSLAAMAHGLVTSTFGFGIVRSLLGVTEAGNFPSAIKTTAEWFPKKERAFATGIFNSGANIGAIVAPLTVPFIAVQWGWQWAFILTGAIGFIWLILWWRMYDIPSRHPRVSPEELAYIERPEPEDIPAQEGEEKSVRWVELLRFRQTWAFIAGKFFTDPVWWFYLFWLPAFLTSEYGLGKTEIALPVALVYTISTLGSVLGGYLPLYFTNLNWPVFKARKTAMFIYAMAALPALTAQYLGSLNMWLAVFIIGLACSAHQAWSANIFTTVSDMFPKRTVASVTGMGGMAGALGGVLIAKIGPMLFDHYKALGELPTGYFIMFLYCGSAYLIGWTIMHFLVPKMKMIELD